MPTAKVTKNVSAAIGGGNVLCSTLISIKTKAWLYSFRHGWWNGMAFRMIHCEMKQVYFCPDKGNSFC